MKELFSVAATWPPTSMKEGSSSESWLRTGRMYGHRLRQALGLFHAVSFSLGQARVDRELSPVVVSTPPGIFLEFSKILLFYSISFQRCLYPKTGVFQT